MENMGAFQFRGVQLDLARQMETLDFIYEFIDFIGKSGYNTLVLYLEGRIKTKSFPYPVAGEYYTPEEMKAVVSYASKKNIDVIPVVSVLGHAELFLKHKINSHDRIRSIIPTIKRIVVRIQFLFNFCSCANRHFFS